MTAEFKFRAVDAFMYVDTYRRHLLYPAPRILTDLNRIKEQMLDPNANLAPSRLYAELRALEHALAFVNKREEPGLVVLDVMDDSATVTSPTGATEMRNAKQLATDLQKCSERAESLESVINQGKKRIHEQQAELAAREQHISRLDYRLSTSQSTITVLSVALAVAALVLILVLIF